MSLRRACGLITCLLSSIVVGPLSGQPTPAAKPPAFQILNSRGTPQEGAQIQAITSRLKAKFGADAALTKRLDDAASARDFATARRLIADAAQVRPEDIYFGQKARSTGSRAPNDLYRFAAFVSSARFNPFWLIFGSGTHVYCLGVGTNGKAECHDALIQAGYTPLT